MKKAYDIIATGAQNGADQNGDLLDTLNEYSAQYSALGLSADQFVNGLITGSEQGVFSIDKVGDAVKEFNIRAKDGSDSTIAAFGTLGMNADDMMSKFAQGGETANEAFFDVVSALDSMKDPIEKNTTAVALFGTQYEDLESTVLPVLSSMQDGAIQTSGALEQINQIKYDNIDSALEGTKRSIQGVFLPAVSEMSSGITDIFSNLANEINQADGNMSEISNSIADALGDILNVIMEQMPMFIEMGLNIITSIGSAIVGNLPVIIDSAISIISTLMNALLGALPQITQGALQLLMAIVNGLVDNLPLILNSALLLITTLAEGLIEYLPTLVPTIIQLVLDICTFFVDNLPLIIDLAMQIILALADGLIIALPDLIKQVPYIINTFADAIYSLFPQIFSLGFDLLVKLGKGIVDNVSVIKENIGEIIKAIINVISLVNLASMGKSLISKFGDGIKSMISSIKNIIQDIISSIVSKFNAFEWSSIGKNIVLGLWNGIKSLASWLLGNVRDWAGSILSSICGVFDINSPSGETEWVGDMLVEGLSGSVKKNGKKAINSVVDMGKGIMDTFNDLSADMTNGLPTDFSANVQGSVSSNLGNSNNTGLSLVLNIQAFHNYSNEDIRSLTNEIMVTAGEFAKRKGVVFA